MEFVEGKTLRQWIADQRDLDAAGWKTIVENDRGGDVVPRTNADGLSLRVQACKLRHGLESLGLP